MRGYTTPPGSMPSIYSLRTAIWVLLRPTRIRTVKELWEESYHDLIRRRLKCLTIRKCHNEGSTFSSQFTINLHDFTFSLAARGSLRQERRTTARGLHNLLLLCQANSVRSWYFCFFIEYREPGSFCGKKRGETSRDGLLLQFFLCRMSVTFSPLIYLFSGHREEKMWQSPGTGNSFHVIINQPRDVYGYLQPRPQDLLAFHRHIGKRKDPGDEVGLFVGNPRCCRTLSWLYWCLQYFWSISAALLPRDYRVSC